jgi:hypothetical protein
MPMLSIRVTEEVLARLRAAALSGKTTVTDLLLKPWRTVSTGVVDILDTLDDPVPEKKPTKAPASPKGKFVGVDPVTGKAVYR